jgi:hypothetical protein
MPPSNWASLGDLRGKRKRGGVFTFFDVYMKIERIQQQYRSHKLMLETIRVHC